VKGLISLTLAASLLGGAGAWAQADHQADAAGIARIAGQKFYAADGSSLTFFVYEGGLAREIHTPDGTALVEVFAFKTSDAGTVSESEDTSRIDGKFELTDDGLATAFDDGRTEILTASGEGLSMMANSPSGEEVCTSWYPEGHRFSEAERKAAMIEVTERLGSGTQHVLSAAVRQSCDGPLGNTHEALARDRVLQLASRAL
jgi:hypothetical protein